MLNGAVVLITGGTGSFGEAMVDRLLPNGCAEIRILSRDEEKQETMRARLNDNKVKFHIGDVRDRGSVDAAMRGVDMVFHAAALKQVPSCEFFPLEAVRTNILGSSNVLESAVANRVNAVVCLSTDKAVMPINTMGLTKAVMEKVVQATARRLAESDTLLCAVRYGNVMCSRGSVIPLFIRQILQRRPLTVTDPQMTRFMLPLSEAVGLVEFAFENGRQGDVFVKKAPACTIGDLAEALCEIFQVDDDRRVIGIRHGEKIYETLATAEEIRRSDDMGDYFRIPMDTRDLNYAVYYTTGERVDGPVADYHSHNTHRLSARQVRDLLLTLPEIHEALAEFKSKPGISGKG